MGGLVINYILDALAWNDVVSGCFRRSHQSQNDYPKHQELIAVVQSGNEVELKDTLNWAFWAKRKKGRWSDEQIMAHVLYRLDFTRDMLEHGMKEPILIQPNGVGIDGGNRAAVQRLLGYESIIVRVV